MSSKKKDEIYKDERFAHLINNPRFKKMPTREGKVKIDNRFKSMFNDEKFKVKYSVDKYGRQVNNSTAEDLKKYYEQSSEESSDEEEKEEELTSDNAILEGGHDIPDNLKDKLKNLEVDYIRGEGVLQSDSSDEESSSDEADEVFIEHVWGELDHDAETTEDSTRRIACMHMDWDRIRAVDILMMCNSFIPSGSGTILSVKIFPSEFGKERMAKEELQGPQELTNKTSNESDHEDVDEEDEAYKEKLREYQLNRLKYYYAVIEFDSVKCADIVYKECDGLEYESTANRMDLRFIPDDLEFEDEPKDVCTELPDKSKYVPRIFFTTALQQAKVELTWDETDVSRKEISEKLFSDKRNEINDQDLKKFVACSSSEGEESEEDEGTISSDDEEKPKDKLNLYKSLLQDINQKEEDKKKKQVEMEFSWGVGINRKESEDDEPSKSEELTPFEKILEKKKLKKKAKKEARKKKFKNGDKEDSEENGYSSSDFDDIDMNDPYFAEEFANDEFKLPKKLSKKNKKQKSKNVESDDEDKVNAQKELELLLDDDEDKAHFSLKKIQENETMSSSKRKRKLKKTKKETKSEEAVDNFELNLKDNRFNAVYTRPDFNIDPTDPNFKKTKGMEVLIQEKLKRRFDDNDGAATNAGISGKKQKIKDVSLNMLVKNIKRKAGK